MHNEIPSKNNYLYGNPINLVTWSGRLMKIIRIIDDILQLLALTLSVFSSVFFKLRKGWGRYTILNYSLVYHV